MLEHPSETTHGAAPLAPGASFRPRGTRTADRSLGSVARVLGAGSNSAHIARIVSSQGTGKAGISTHIAGIGTDDGR